MTPYHRYTYYTFVAQYWYDQAAKQVHPIYSPEYAQHCHYDALAQSQFTLDVQRRAATGIYLRYKALGYDAASYSELWPYVVTR